MKVVRVDREVPSYALFLPLSCPFEPSATRKLCLATIRSIAPLLPLCCPFASNQRVIGTFACFSVFFQDAFVH